MNDKPKATWQQNVLVILGILIVILLTLNLVSPKLISPTVLSKFTGFISTPTPTIDVEQVKKDALAKFYKELSTAQDNKDWATLYDFLPQTLRSNVTKDQFLAAEKKLPESNSDSIQKTTVNSIVVTGDNGVVDRTTITCYASVYKTSLKKIITAPTDAPCTGDFRKEENAKKNYVYINGKWQIPDPTPSDRALKAAAFDYQNYSPADRKSFIEGWGFGSDDSNFAIKEYALSLDSDNTKLINEEASIEKYKADQANKPKIIYQDRPVYVPAPAPIIQNNSMNCTSNKIGNYTYTNCY